MLTAFAQRAKIARVCVHSSDPSDSHFLSSVLQNISPLSHFDTAPYRFVRPRPRAAWEDPNTSKSHLIQQLGWLTVSCIFFAHMWTKWYRLTSFHDRWCLGVCASSPERGPIHVHGKFSMSNMGVISGSCFKFRFLHFDIISIARIHLHAWWVDSLPARPSVLSIMNSFSCLLLCFMLIGSKVFKSAPKDACFSFKLVSMVLACTGGGILVPIFINQIPVTLANDAYPIAVLVSFVIHYYFPIVREVVNISPIVKVCWSSSSGYCKWMN